MNIDLAPPKLKWNHVQGSEFLMDMAEEPKEPMQMARTVVPTNHAGRPRCASGHGLDCMCVTAEAVGQQ